MGKSIRTNILKSLIIVLCLSLCFGYFAFGSTKIVKATEPAVSSDFKMVGASIQLVPQGTDGAIRFVVECSETDYALIGEGATSGMLILPTKFLGSEELVVNKTFSEKSPRVKVLDDLWEKVEDKYVAYVYMYNIPSTDYNTSLTARAYFTVNETTYYANTVDRSIAYVAGQALIDGNPEYIECCNDIVSYVVDDDFDVENIEVDSWETFDLTLKNNHGINAKFSTNDTDIIEIDDNKLRAIKDGSATVKASIGSKEVSATVTVNASQFETFTPEDLSSYKVIAKGKTTDSYAYKSTQNYSGHIENLGLNIKANEYVQISKPISFVRATSMFTMMWFNELTADEYKGTTLNLLFTSISNSAKRFLIRLRVGQDGYVYTSILGGANFNYQYEIKNPTSQVGTSTGYINIRTNVGGENTNCQIDNSYAFTMKDIADYGDMYLTIFSDADVKIAFDYLGDELYAGYTAGYDNLLTLKQMADAVKLSALNPTIEPGLKASNLYAKGSTVNSYVGYTVDYPLIYSKCLKFNLMKDEWITVSEDYTNIGNGFTTFIFNEMTLDEYKGAVLTMLFVSKANTDKKAALEFTIEDNGTVYLTNVLGGELSSAINCGTVPSTTQITVLSNVGGTNPTSFQIYQNGRFTMPDLGACTVSFTANKNILFALSYFNDARGWNKAEATWAGFDDVVKFSDSADATKDISVLYGTQPLDSTTFNGEVAKGSDEKTFVYSTSNPNYKGISIVAGDAITFAPKVHYKNANNTYITRSQFNTEMNIENGTEISFIYIPTADPTKRFSYTAHFYDSGNYMTFTGTNLDPGDKRTLALETLFKVYETSGVFGVQTEMGGFAPNYTFNNPDEMILVITSNKDVRFTIDYLDDRYTWADSYNTLTDYDSHITE